MQIRSTALAVVFSLGLSSPIAANAGHDVSVASGNGGMGFGRFSCDDCRAFASGDGYFPSDYANVGAGAEMYDCSTGWRVCQPFGAGH